MENISSFVIEKLKVNKDARMKKLTPLTRKELRDMIIKILDEEGPDANLNEIDTSKITDMNHLFSRISSKVGNPDVSDWDVSKVENMAFMFSNCKKFNCDITKWDVSSCKDMSSMFNECESFNQDLTEWDVSNVENFSEMFENCTSFNGDVSHWDMNKAKDISSMFFGASKFEGKGLNTWTLPNNCWRRKDIFIGTNVRKKDIFN